MLLLGTAVSISEGLTINTSIVQGFQKNKQKTTQPKYFILKSSIFSKPKWKNSATVAEWNKITSLFSRFQNFSNDKSTQPSWNEEESEDYSNNCQKKKKKERGIEKKLCWFMWKKKNFKLKYIWQQG